LAYRWFSGLGFEREIPDHSTFSKNRHGRFRGAGVFLEVFEEIVRRCMEAGLPVTTNTGTKVRSAAPPGIISPTPNSVAYTIDEDGTLVPDRREEVSDPPPVPDEEIPDPGPERTRLTITEYRYEYDQNGNWTERTVVNREESYEQSTVYRRTLTYF